MTNHEEEEMRLCVTRLSILLWNKMEGGVDGQVLNSIEHYKSVRTMAEGQN